MSSPAPDGQAARGAAAPPGQVLAVASGKGGVGKSNVAAGLGILLASGGARVALVDGDFGTGNLDILMGVTPGLTLTDLRTGGLDIRDVLLAVGGGVDLAAGDACLGGDHEVAAACAAVVGSLGLLRADHDVVIVDCASGVRAEVRAVCAAADQVIVVATPEPTAVTDAYALIKVLHVTGYHGRVSVLVNMALGHADGKATYGRLSSVSWQFLGRTVFDAGYVLTDPKVPAAVRERRPVVLAYPRCPASRCLAGLAAKLRPRWVAPWSDERGGRLVGRIVRWIG